jgi:hypothetical protein
VLVLAAMSREVQVAGQVAENRVCEIANKAGYTARLATTAEDYSKKTDVVIENKPVQVSVSGKSKNQRKLLSKLGIKNIVAGAEVEDGNILTQILALFS